MSNQRILELPTDEKILRAKSQDVVCFDQKTQKIISDLFDTLKSSERPGVGLAAPQIGHNLKIVVIESAGYEREDGELTDVLPRTVLINPKIVKYSSEKVEMDEGCLSVPDVMGPVSRPKKIKVEAQDENGKKICINTGGFFARVIQHEVDHLDGILFIDLAQKDKLHRIHKREANED